MKRESEQRVTRGQAGQLGKRSGVSEGQNVLQKNNRRVCVLTQQSRRQQPASAPEPATLVLLNC